MRDDIIFEIEDKTNRKIRLTKTQWKHVIKYHRYMVNYLDKIKETLINPLAITDNLYDEKVRYYYSYLKHIPQTEKYLFIAVRYLNGDGFIITTYLRKNIK